MKKGKFIVFEGTDGSGKSTQIKLLSDYLISKGEKVLLTREPTDSVFGKLLRDCLAGRVQTNEKTIAAMFAADRLDHIYNEENGIESLLDRGYIVLCDRYYFSSFAYNGEFVSPEWVHELNRPARRARKADLTVFIDVSPEEGMKRVSVRADQDRYETLEKQKRIRERYFAVFNEFQDGENIAIIESQEKMEDTQALIQKEVNALMGY